MLSGVGRGCRDQVHAARDCPPSRREDHVERIALSSDLRAGVTRDLLSHEDPIGIEQLRCGPIPLAIRKRGVAPEIRKQKPPVCGLFPVGPLETRWLSHAVECRTRGFLASISPRLDAGQYGMRPAECPAQPDRCPEGRAMHAVQDLLVLAALGAAFVGVLLGLRATRPLDDGDDQGNSGVKP